MDPVILLRSYASANQSIPTNDGSDVYVFGEWACPKATKTNIKASGGDYYSLVSLVFLLNRDTLDYGSYILEARRANVPHVSLTDRKEVLDYLRGRSADCSKIDKSVIVPLAERVSAAATAATTTAAAAAAAAGKRPVADTREGPKRPRGDVPVTSSEKETEKAIDVGELKDLNPELTSEKIADLKAKMRARKRAEVSLDDVLKATEPSVDVDASKTTEILARERTYVTRNSILRGRKTFDELRKTVKETKKQDGADAKKGVPGKPETAKATEYDRYKQEKRDEGAEFGINAQGTFLANRKKPQPAQTTAATDPKAAPAPTEPKRKTSKIPIIIVPAGAKSLITLHNARLLLEEGKFVPPTELADKGEAKPQNVVINHKRNGKTVPYKVVDNTTGFTPEHWHRVVAVFVAGPEWQFKGWPWIAQGGTPVDVFHNIKGFHLKYAGDATLPSVQGWDVTIIQIDRMQRFRDNTAQYRFWEVLDGFTSTKRRDLAC